MRVGAAVITGVLAAGLSVAAPSAVATASTACAPWTATTVASGFGALENLSFGGGAMYLSETSPLGPGNIVRLGSDGSRSIAVGGVSSPGGQVVDGHTLYFTTGNGTASGLFGTPDGTIDTLDLETGARATYAGGLVMPNGLARSRDGDMFTTRDIGDETGLTVVPVAEPHTPVLVRTDLGTANGIAIDGSNLYVANTFEPNLEIAVLQTEDPDGIARRISVDGFGPFTASDDMTVGPDGQIYLAQNIAGRVLRIDPQSGSSCVIASGLPLTSSVAFGGPGFDRNSLYATSFAGTVSKLSPF